LRILLVAPYFRDSFAGKISMGSAVAAAHHLSRRHQVLVITTGRQNPEERVSENLTISSAPALLLPDPINYVISPHSLVRVVRAIRKFDPNVVFVNKFMFFTSFAAPIAKWMGKPTVVVTDTYPGLNWFPRSRLVGSVMWVYARLIGIPILRSADKVVLLHEGLVDLARKYRLDYTVIHNGPDLEAADAAEPAKDLVKPPGEVWIGYVGRLESVKGYDFLMNAVESIARRSPNVKAFFIGAHRPRALRDSKALVFLGFRDDVYSVLKRMDVFCLPSLSEGLPNAVMEAMAVRCPVVASRVGGVEALVTEGVSGLLVAPRDEAALGDEELRRRLGAAGRLRIEEDFDWRRLLERYEELFEELMRSEKAPDPR
jgi:glycosyltransferase involved in cell wall biosynthesis